MVINTLKIQVQRYSFRPKTASYSSGFLRLFCMPDARVCAIRGSCPAAYTYRGCSRLYRCTLGGENYTDCFFALCFVCTLLQCQRNSGLVAYFTRAEVLDRPGVDICCLLGPLFAVCGKVFEGLAFEVDKCFLYHGLHLAVATLHIHHHGYRYTACHPFSGRMRSIAYACHIAGLALAYEQRSGITE